MAEWKGLDPGGTEQLWDSTVLVDVLRILKANEPFSRNDSQSPIFDDLEEKYPAITWRNFDSNDSFRPIFRKTNPWAKLGLITNETTDAIVTPLGDELLSGESSISEVFAEALKSHIEPEGEKSFGIMCSAALELPTEVFSLEDVEFAVSRAFSSGSKSLIDALNEVRTKKVAFSSGSRRPRTLRTFMDSLVTSGALINAAGGWTLNNEKIAAEIASGVSAASTTPVSKTASANSQTTPLAPAQTFKTIESGKRHAPTFDVLPSTYDPIKRALLLEKANTIHESLVEKCAQVMSRIGMEPVEDANTFDVAAIKEQVIVEVKSIHQSNAVSQIRKAIAQLPEYRWRFRSVFGNQTKMVIVTNCDPSQFVDEEFLLYLSQDRGIQLFWQQADSFTDASGQKLEEFLSQL